MPAITVAFIMDIDTALTTVDRLAQLLQVRKIQPSLFCTQTFPENTRLIIICELEPFAVGLTARRIQKLDGIKALECLLPKQYTFRPTPPGLLASLQPAQ